MNRLKLEQNCENWVGASNWYFQNTRNRLM